MNPYEIIDKYYPENTEQRQILVIHSLSVSGSVSFRQMLRPFDVSVLILILLMDI